MCLYVCLCVCVCVLLICSIGLLTGLTGVLGVSSGKTEHVC